MLLLNNYWLIEYLYLESPTSDELVSWLNLHYKAQITLNFPQKATENQRDKQIRD